MNQKQLDKIKELTGYDYNEILTMSDGEFFFRVAKKMTLGKLSLKQYNWLDKKRKLGDNLEKEATIGDVIRLFGGEEI